MYQYNINTTYLYIVFAIHFIPEGWSFPAYIDCKIKKMLYAVYSTIRQNLAL